MRLLVVIPIALAAVLPLSTAPAKADTHEIIHQAFAVAEGWADQLADRADQAAAQAHAAIVLGGIIVSQNRNIISGGAVGCTLGAVTGMGSTAALAVPTGGATLPVIPDAMALGCALGAAGGAALGYKMDYPDYPVVR